MAHFFGQHFLEIFEKAKRLTSFIVFKKNMRSIIAPYSQKKKIRILIFIVKSRSQKCFFGILMLGKHSHKYQKRSKNLYMGNERIDKNRAYNFTRRARVDKIMRAAS